MVGTQQISLFLLRKYFIQTNERAVTAQMETFFLDLKDTGKMKHLMGSKIAYFKIKNGVKEKL